MNIAALLADKGSDVATITGGEAIATAVAHLGQRGIGALVVVTNDGTLEGILSERDIVRALSAEGSEILSKPVRELMTEEVVTCHPGNSVAELMAIMTVRRIRHVPVMAEGQLAGLISIGDVVKHRLGELEKDNQTLRDYVSSW